MCEYIVKENRANKATAFERKPVSSKTAPATMSSLEDLLQKQKEDVQEQVQNKVDSIVISKITRIITQVFQTRVSRTSSYIPTSEKYKHSQCGFINIKKTIINVFIGVWNTMHLLEEKCDGLSVLNKL